LASNGDTTAPCGVPAFVSKPLSVLHHARLQPFLDQADDPFVSYPMPYELFHVIMSDLVEK
jgi:hypothetical protein